MNADERFQEYLFEMDDVLERFLSDLGPDGARLDYSVESLDALEEILSARTGQSESNDEMLINRAARYVGEVFRKNLGGVWRLCKKSKDYLYYGLPVVTEYSRKDIEFCPSEVVRNFLRRGRKGLIKVAVESNRPWLSTGQ